MARLSLVFLEGHHLIAHGPCVADRRHPGGLVRVLGRLLWTGGEHKASHLNASSISKPPQTFKNCCVGVMRPPSSEAMS